MAVGSGVTSLGIHYLLPGDGPDTAGISQQMATDIGVLLADTGWKNIALNTSNYQSAGNTPQYRIKAGVVYLRGDVKTVGGANFPANGTFTLAPDGALPVPDGGQAGADKLINVGGPVAARALVTGTGGLIVQSGPATVATFNISGLSGYTTTATS